ncbi:hypothetical protein MTX78_06310 [Hymenobacter tibetensis]|uniref:Uncharacterized protein n=1 Tax=Hymenobacter tibetensis TaxID=497967 RepID=A0ABY4D101_9BACT|nr:hypothetical protein [Hymenobacter tibetensis]UOG76206.1 hypothetical protein MTX78_06310 [Hymenobacter tibetensis]
MNFTFIFLFLLLAINTLFSFTRESSVKLSLTRKIALAPAVTDTLRFPATYATALPTLTPLDQWEKDYNRYERFLTPNIRRTQQGLSFAKNGVKTWWVANSASPHAQLDTTTRITNPDRLLGNWRTVANRVVVHIDSFSVADQKMYRSAIVHELPGTVALTVTNQKFSLQTDEPKANRLNRNYALIQQRYLLLYGASRAAGSVAQIGMDQEGRLLLHTCGVTERKVPGRYLTYQTIIRQSILTRQ